MSKSTFFAVAAMALGASAQLFPANSTTSDVGAGATGLSGTGSSTAMSSSVAGGIATTLPVSANATTIAPSSTGFNNATSVLPATSTASGAAAPTASDPVFCPALSGDIYVGPLDISYSISCDVSMAGLLIDVTVLPTAVVTKRQSTNETSLQDCLQICSGLPQCVATAFDTNNPECFFYSSLDAAFAANGIEFATKESTNATTSATVTPSSTGSRNATSSATSGPFATSNGTSSAISSSSRASSGLATGTSTSSSASATATIDLFCPNLNAQVFVDPSGIQFLIECSLNHVGVIIDVTATLRKRQAVAPASLGDCLSLCAATTSCVGTGFNTAEKTCTLFSSIGAAYSDLDVEFGVVVAPATTITPGQEVTSTIFATSVQTISSCAPTVTDCPLDGGVTVVTEVIPVSSTVYICPTYSTIPASPVACTSCPYAVVTATAYSQTVQTIYSCAPDVTNCPYNTGSAIAPATSTVAVVTTNAAGAVVTVTSAIAPVATNTAAGSNYYVTEVVTSTVTTCPVGYTMTTGGTTTVLTAPSVITTAVNVQSTVYEDVTVTATGTIIGSSGAVVASSAGASSGVVVVASSAVIVSSGVTTTGVVVVSSAVVVGSSAGVSSGAAATVSSQSGVTVITTTQVVAGPTVVINYPVPTSTGAMATAAPSVVTSVGTAGSSAVVASSGSGSGSSATVSTQAGSSATTTGVLAFTGAANSLVGPAGMAGAVVAAVALML